MFGESDELAADAVSTVGGINGKRTKPARLAVDPPSANGADQATVFTCNSQLSESCGISRFGGCRSGDTISPQPLLSDLIGPVNERAQVGNDDCILRRRRGKHFNLQHRGKTTPALETVAAGWASVLTPVDPAAREPAPPYEASSFSNRSESSNGPITASRRPPRAITSCATRWMSSAVTASRFSSIFCGSSTCPSSTSRRRP